jgi:hypothetical protein
MLQLAIALLRHGYPLPTDLAARLLDAGFDVTALEAKYAL